MNTREGSGGADADWVIDALVDAMFANDVPEMERLADALIDGARLEAGERAAGRNGRPGWEKVTAWCACGGSFSARSAPAGVARDAVDMWRDLHADEGCHPVDQAEHRRICARLRREERRMLEEAARG